uniref:Uncharacterized protein n=1 Tax=Timema monikensis TaxID=170555 RepID=A0A7R9HQB5_9NEOP|nr:unnamed protein product [Timema monikensis]
MAYLSIPSHQGGDSWSRSPREEHLLGRDTTRPTCVVARYWSPIDNNLPGGQQLYCRCIIAPLCGGSSCQLSLSTKEAMELLYLQTRGDGPTCPLPSESHWHEYTEEIERLRQDLVSAREKSGVYLSIENYNKMIAQMEQSEKEMSQKLSTIKLLNEQMEEKELICQQLNMKLERRTQRLQETHQTLCVTKRERDETAHLLERHMQTEEVLGDQARTLLSVAEESSKDTYRLHDKLSRKSKNIDKKSAECRTCRKNFKTPSGTTKTLLNHLQKHPGKYKEFLDENNKKDLPAPAPRKDRTVQQNIQTMLSREKMVSSHPYAQTTTNKITNMLVKGLLPYSFVEEEGFVELVKHFAPNYKIPARTTFSRNYLAVDDSKSECPGVKKLLQKAKNIVGHYRRSSQARERLHSLQERMQVPQLELIQYVETRWSSEYCMLQRLVEMKGPIAAELAQSEHNIEPLTNADWAQAKGVLEVLEPLAQATKEISGDSYPTSSMVIPILHCLSSHLNSRIQRQEEANLSTALRNELYRDFEEMDSTADEPEPSTSNSGLWSFFDSLPNERKEMNISEEVEKYLSEPRVYYVDLHTNWLTILLLLRSVESENEDIIVNFHRNMNHDLSLLEGSLQQFTQVYHKYKSGLESNLGDHLEDGVAHLIGLSNEMSTLVESHNKIMQQLKKGSSERVHDSKRMIQDQLASLRQTCDLESNKLHTFHVDSASPGIQNILYFLELQKTVTVALNQLSDNPLSLMMKLMEDHVSQVKQIVSSVKENHRALVASVKKREEDAHKFREAVKDKDKRDTAIAEDGSYLFVCYPASVASLTVSFHIGSNTDAKPEVLISQESAPKPPTPLKDHTCKPQYMYGTSLVVRQKL